MSNQESAPLGYASGPRKRLPGSLKWLTLVGIFIAIVYMLLPRVTRCDGNVKRTYCGSNLAAIARACLTYAEGNRGALPSNLQMLCIGGERAYLSPKQLVCVSQLPYIYISNQKNNADPRNVLAYEPSSYHKGAGGNVAFLDGAVKWCVHPEAVAAETEARHRAATKPMQ